MWEFVPIITGRLTFVIIRKTTDNKYKCVGSNQIDITGNKLICFEENMFNLIICITTTKNDSGVKEVTSYPDIT